MKRIIYIAAITFSIISCSSDKKEEIQEKKEAQITENNFEANGAPQIITLNQKAKEELQDWKNYEQLDEMVSRLKDMSIPEAYSNASELSYLTKVVKDSIAIKQLDIPAVRVRLNLLNNEALRLKDISTIEDVNLDSLAHSEIYKIVIAFSNVNDRINAVYRLDELRSNPNLTKMDSLFLKDLKSLKDSTEVIRKQKRTNDTLKTKNSPLISPNIGRKLLKPNQKSK
ncbi:hypothetical protein [Aureivirga sp. CE67]|uniref:hypothetical protein n=1 Tax=Aureivirga sp. CE67 TaxID=1788983 RepID=UPI0018C9F3B2|nr:hypothetical protein [Aureivirga sp. CE67]